MSAYGEEGSRLAIRLPKSRADHISIASRITIELTLEPTIDDSWQNSIVQQSRRAKHKTDCPKLIATTCLLVRPGVEARTAMRSTTHALGQAAALKSVLEMSILRHPAAYPRSTRLRNQSRIDAIETGECFPRWHKTFMGCLHCGAYQLREQCSVRAGGN